MVGLPGSGKTFFAAQFAKAFGSPFIDINELSGYCQDDAAAAVVGKTFLQEIAKTKQPFIYEGDSNTRARRSEFVRWARSEGYRPVIIWVQTDVTTARSRSVKNQRLSREAFDYYVRRFSEPNAGELYFVISGKHPYSSQSRAALTFLKQIGQQTEDEALTMNQTIAQGVAGVGTGLNAALKTLGIEAEQYASGISDKAGRAIEAFAVVAKDAGDDTDKLARAWAAMSSAASGSAQEVRAAEAALRQSVGGDEAKADAIKKIADAYKDTGDAAEKALTALNISSADLARGLSTGVSEMLANWQTGMASLKTRGELTAQAVQTAFTSSLSKLSSAADFKALHDEMQRTGTLSRLTAEQMQILRAGMQGGAEAANAMREALKQGTDATRESAEASKAAAEAVGA